MPNIGLPELIVILVIVLLVFGANRLPQIGEGIGKAIRNLKRGLNTDENIEVKEKRLEKKSSAEDVEQGREVEDAEVVDKKS